MPNPDGSAVVLSERRGPAVWLTMNRPDKLNAISQEMVLELRAALGRAAADDEVRVVVLRGAGRAFSAGYDIAASLTGSEGGKSMVGATAWMWRSRLANEIALTMELFHFPKPTIAVVHGWTLAGACELMMACDLAVASEDAMLGEPEIRYGSGPVTLLMPFVMGMRKTKQLLLTGEAIDARTAEIHGLVNTVVPATELEAAAERYVRLLATVPPAVMQLTKKAINKAYEMQGLVNAVDYNMEASAILNGADTPEQQEFAEIARTSGLKAALAWRDERFGKP
ncbi:MAG: hypothetical protein QOH61_2316 [Chloroflexota bacterium]|jgi:enoyl-CoA hydratase|nr:hypothetical protein [Chloroflexota bacterium]